MSVPARKGHRREMWLRCHHEAKQVHTDLAWDAFQCSVCRQVTRFEIRPHTRNDGWVLIDYAPQEVPA